MILLPVLLACGDTDEPGPPPAYYAELAELTERLDEENTAADEALHEELEGMSPGEAGDLFSRITLEGADHLDEVVTELAALTAPAVAGDEHEELLDAAAAMADQDRVTAEAMAGLDVDELGGLDPRPAYRAAEERVDRACAAVQDLATAAGVDVEICVGLFAPPGTGR